jgi:hypothetical protein
VQELARQYTDKAIMALVEICTSSKSDGLLV